MTRYLYPEAKKFMAQNPTLIGKIGNTEFYEHPIYGDEHPLIAILVDGRKVNTPYYDMLTEQEYYDWMTS